MRTIILEGIATSGKSTIIDMIEKAVPQGLSVKIVPESTTIMAIVDNTDREVAVHHVESVVQEAYRESRDLVVFDRLYLTHIFRTGSTIRDFAAIEEILVPYNPLTVYLEVNEATVAERVELASRHRDPGWRDYIFTKGKTFASISKYYIDQQKNQKRLLKGSRIPYKLYDTSSHEYEAIVQDLLADTPGATGPMDVR